MKVNNFTTSIVSLVLIVNFIACGCNDDHPNNQSETLIEELKPSPEAGGSGQDLNKNNDKPESANIVTSGDWEKPAKVGVIITSYNRPEFLRITLESLKYSAIKEGDAKIAIIDSASADPAVDTIIRNFDMPHVAIRRIFLDKNAGPVEGIVLAIDQIGDTVDYFTNLDPDVYLKKGWLDTLIAVHKEINDPNLLLTGFNEPLRHKIIKCGRDGIDTESDPSYCEKEVLGAVHYFFSASFYKSYLHDWLLSQKDWRGWDWRICREMRALGWHLYTTIPSVVQHLGITGFNHKPDSTFDFAPDF